MISLFFIVQEVILNSSDNIYLSLITDLIADQIADSEMRIGKLHLEDQLLRQKYKMGLDELNEALERLESLPNYEEAKIRGIPVLEAAADTRSWEHTIERLRGEEKKLQGLWSLQQASQSQWIVAEGSKYG